MPEALPCRRTVQSILNREYHPIQEGSFRFESLAKHLECYHTPKVIFIREDATCVISRIDYDNETDCLVGFVMPCDDNGVLLTVFFKADCYESMQAIFRNGEFAKYAFVYMAQSLARGVPAFCLACLGTNNRFTSEHVFKRWQYIYTECKKLGITVISFGADGDSCELKSMQVSTNLMFASSNPLASLSPSFKSADKVVIPSEWRQWFAVKHPTTVSYVQDIVHVGVKLKCRLITPSIVLPLGSFVAGVHHLRMVHMKFSKEEHGLRE